MSGSDASFGAFGETRSSFERSDFVSWFALDPAAGQPERYRPNGAAFHDMVSLDLALDESAALTRLTLSIARAMLDDPRHAPFARDIARSFLLAVARPGKGIAAIADEIMHRDLAGPLLMRGDPPALPPDPSPAYRAFAGDGPACTIDLPGLRVILARPGDTRDLRIEAERLPAPPGFFARLRAKWSGR